MFIIATSGRCGTKAICGGLAQFSDHEVRHEPEPMLEEAWLKHQGREYRTETYSARMTDFVMRDGTAYGESFRAPNLLNDVRECAPETYFLVVVREPSEYIRSAHSKQVLRKTDGWDRFRLMPGGADGTLAARIAMHWRTINSYLLDFAEHTGSPVITHRDWSELIRDLPSLLGVRVHDPQSLKAYWSTRPHASETHDLPDGFGNPDIASITEATWTRAQRLDATA